MPVSLQGKIIFLESWGFQNPGDLKILRGAKNLLDSLKGKVIVLERGTCSLVEKVQRAADLGAAAVLVSNNKLGLEHMEHWDQKYRPYMANKKYNMLANAIL